jgi:hypothetical protein
MVPKLNSAKILKTKAVNNQLLGSQLARMWQDHQFTTKISYLSEVTRICYLGVVGCTPDSTPELLKNLNFPGNIFSSEQKIPSNIFSWERKIFKL